MVDSSSIVQRVQKGDWQALSSCPQPLLWAESRLVPAGPGRQGGSAVLLRAQELPLTLASQGAGVQGKHGSSCRPLQATRNENRGSGCSGSALGPRAAAHKQACRKQPSGWAAAQHCAQGPCQGSGDTGIQPQILLHCQAQAEKDMGTSSAEGLILRPWIFFSWQN